MNRQRSSLRRPPAAAAADGAASFVDPRTGLGQAEIPRSWRAFDVLSDCVVHYCGTCALLAGGSQRTDSLISSSSSTAPSKEASYAIRGGGSAKPSFAFGRVPARQLLSDPSCSFVVIVTDQCFYVFDLSAVVIRCLDIQYLDRLAVAEEVLLEDTVVPWQEQLLHYQQQQGRHAPISSSSSSSGRSKGTDFPLCGVLAVAVDRGLLPLEHDVVVALPPGEVHRLCSILLRIRFAHGGTGPGAVGELPIDVVRPPQALPPTVVGGGGGGSTSALSNRQRTAAYVGGGGGGDSSLLQLRLSLPQILHGDELQSLPPLLGASCDRHPLWTLNVVPLRTWAQLEVLVNAKRLQLQEEAKSIEIEFQRLKDQIMEAAAYESDARWQAQLALNTSLAQRVHELEGSLRCARALIESHISNGTVMFARALQRQSESEGSWGGGGGGGGGQHLESDIAWKGLGPLPSSSSKSSAVRNAFGRDALYGEAASSSNENSSPAAAAAAASHALRPCQRCQELEHLLESHPSVDKLRILKAEEALVGKDTKLLELQSSIVPLQNENRQLREVIQDMMAALFASDADEDAARRDPMAPNRVLELSRSIRDAVRMGESFFLSSGLPSPLTASQSVVVKGAAATATAKAATASALAMELRAWRELAAEMDERHRRELESFQQAFVEYDEAMVMAVRDALRSYRPSQGVTLDQATNNIFSLARQRAEVSGQRPVSVQHSGSATPQEGRRTTSDEPHGAASRGDAIVARPQETRVLDRFEFPPPTDGRRSFAGPWGPSPSAATAFSAQAKGNRLSPPPPPPHETAGGALESKRSPFESRVRWATVS